MDTFDNMEPIEAPTEIQQEGENAEGLETFDDMEPILEETTERKEGDSQVDQLDEEEEKVEKTEKTTSEDKGDKDEDRTQEADSESKEEDDDTQTEEQIPEGKTIRLKEGNKSHDLNENATVKVKVNGKGKFVSLRELKEGYSGEQAYSTKIAEANRNLEIAKVEREKAEGASQHLQSTVENFVKTLQDDTKNPIDAIVNLLDQFGKNGHTYIRKLVETQSQLGSELSELTETEQELFWTNFENKNLQNIQASREERQRQEEAQRGLVAHVDALREKYGITEEDFIVGARELSATIPKESLTAEMVVEHLAMQPHVTSVEELTKDFVDDMDDAEYEKLVADSARVLFQHPEMEQIQAVKLVAKKMGYDIETDDELVEEVKSRQPKQKETLPKTTKVADKGEDHLESFDDFDDF